MIHILIIDNGEIFEDLKDNTSATFTREHHLLKNLLEFEDIDLISIPYKQFPRTNIINIIVNNFIKSIITFRFLLILAKKKPMVFFTYPNSFSTIQNRLLFQFCKFMKLKTILDVQDTIEQADAISNKKAKLTKKDEKYILANAKLLIIMNEQTKDYIMNQYKLNSDKNIAIISHGFENTFVRKYPIPYESIKGRFNVCYVGGITKNRGIDILVPACIELNKKYPFLKLYLFGFYGDGISDYLREIIEKSDFIIRKKIPRKEIVNFFQEVDTFVMPYNPNVAYLNRCSPTKFYEYIGCGKPIVCTKCESVFDVGKNDSILYVDYEIEDFIKNLEYLINNPQIREERANKIFDMRLNYTWSQRANDLHKAIRFYFE